MEQNRFSGGAATAAAGLQLAEKGGFVPSRIASGNGSRAFEDEAHAAFQELVMGHTFPCVGARAAFNSESYALATYRQIVDTETTAALARDLYEFTRSDIRRDSEYATFVAVFRGPTHQTEQQFEGALWSQLQQLNRLDATHFDWDHTAQSDPTDPQFSFSFAGQALYVIGMHPNSSRLARQFPWPTMIFNPHEQFERLRADGKWKRMQETIRERDVELQGSINPMLSDFGESTEARQYSGRAVEADWRAPFDATKPASVGKCPFGH
ncbi:MAG: guanitoxin biosynthesis heme-dependent pre-guanitoxin N-hydroxylase GntA [Chthoniobacterales bacterium]